MSWDNRWMQLAAVVASWSKDRKKKVGAVIVDERNSILGIGFNGFARGVDDDVDARHERPAKYMWTIHAEANAIANAASTGTALMGGTIYTTLCPCTACCMGIVQAGIVRVVCPEPDWDHERWGVSFQTSAQMFKECGIEVTYV